VSFDAALARGADLVIDLLTRHLETRHLEAIAPRKMPTRRRSTRLPPDGPGPGAATPRR
jgi:hypothetical protein